MPPPDNDDTQLEDDAASQPISVPDSGDAGESGKLKMIISLLKKCLGVKDIASMYVVFSTVLQPPLHALAGDFRSLRLCSSPFPTWSIGTT